MYPRAYVALGDSFTAGTGCASGEGFADLLAARLRRSRPTLRYRNLGFDGASPLRTASRASSSPSIPPSPTPRASSPTVFTPSPLSHACLAVAFEDLLVTAVSDPETPVPR